MEMQTWHSGIKHLFEQIGKTFAQMCTGETISKNIDITKTAEGTQVIYSSRMIIVFVREQHPIQTVEGHSQHLFTEVGTTINQYTRLANFHQYRHT